MELFHGSFNHNKFEKNVFFSSCENFACDYGEVKKYSVTMKNTFDTTKEEHVNIILNSYDEIIDLYDNESYNSFEEYKNSCSFALDTWEIFEQYINFIKSNGFDSMMIFEGGIENYVVFSNDFEALQ